MKTFRELVESVYSDGVKSGKFDRGYNNTSKNTIMLPGYPKGTVDFYIGDDKGYHADKAKYYADKVENLLNKNSFTQPSHDKALRSIYHNAMNAHIEAHITGKNSYNLPAEHHEHIVKKAEEHHKIINDFETAPYTKHKYNSENMRRMKLHQDALVIAKDPKNTRGEYSTSKGTYLKSKFDSLSDKAI